MRSILLLFAVFTSLLGAAQSQRKIINTCGNSYSSSGALLKASVGEPVVGMHATTQASLAQGFFQSKPAPVVIPPPPAGYSFYPNPVKEVLLIKGDITKLKQLQVYDAMGKIISTANITGNIVSIKSLSAGLYTARLIGDNGNIIYYSKLLKL